MKFLLKLIWKPFGCLISLVLSLIVLALIAAVVGVMLLNHFASDIVGRIVEQRTGFHVDIGSQEVNLLQGAVDFKNLRIINPARFPAPDFIHFSELKTTVDLLSLKSDTVVVKELVLDIDTLAVVKTKDGQNNVTDFVSGISGDEPASAGSTPTATMQAAPPAGGSTTVSAGASPAATAPAPLGAKPGRGFLIKTLTIRIGTLKYFDYSRGDGTPQSTTLDYERTFTNVTDVKDVEMQVAKDLLLKGCIFAGKAILTALTDSGTYGDAARNILQQISGLPDNAAIKAGTELFKNAAGSILDLFK